MAAVESTVLPPGTPASVTRYTILAPVFALVCMHSAGAGVLIDEVIEQSQQNFPEYLELLEIPNVPDQPQDMQRNARFLERAFQKRGFETHLLENPAGRPAVLARLASAPARAATILFYMHFDGQPVIAEEWSQENPFSPVVRKQQDGKWRDVNREDLTAKPFDPELRVYARSSSDDKAPIMMLLTAIDLLRTQGTPPAIDVKVFLDPEEEIGSPNLAGTIERRRELFDADGMVILDGPAHASGRPTLVFGNRGITQATLTVFGPEAPLHSGHFGNYAPNPAQRLAHLLASMKDADGRVLIPGYYDGVNLTPADRAALAGVPDDPAVLRRRIGVARPDRIAENYQEALQYPSLNVRGMAAAAVGSKAANVIPSEAVAELDLRTTPESDGRRLFDLLKRHIERQGYHLVDQAPSDQERARYEKLASLRLHSVQAAVRMPLDSPLGRWALTALKSPTAPDADAEPVRIRMMGGTVPTDVLVDALDLPFILMPTVNPDNNQHARDENLRLGHFVSGVEAIYSLLSTPY